MLVISVLMRWQPMCRYGVPGTHAKRLEEAMRFNAPARFEQERDLLHHLVALAPPSLLVAQGEPSSSTLEFFPVTVAMTEQ